jgi:hypothetical protein
MSPTQPRLRRIRRDGRRLTLHQETHHDAAVGREVSLMGRVGKFAQVDRATIERVLAECGQSVLAAATHLGMSGNHLYLLMRRFGIAPPPRQPRPARQRLAVEVHPPQAVIATELADLRQEARLLVRTYAPCPYRTQELLRIEARHRHLLALLRGAIGPAEASDTRERSPAILSRGIAGLT